MSIILAILVFSLLIFSHELGHFLLAKKNGIGVTEFAIGMGPTLLHFDRKETRYSLKAIPFGGFCQMVGELEDDSADMPENSFNSKGPWARLSVILAGPVFNFIFAWILSMILIYNIGIDSTVINSVAEGLPCEAAGMQAGDEIIAINGKRIHFFKELQLHMSLYPGEHVDITYERDGMRYTASIDPMYQAETGSYMIGVSRGGYEEVKNPLDLVMNGIYEVRYWISYTLTSLKMLIRGQVGLNDMSGAVGIVDTLDTIVEETKDYGVQTVLLNLINFCILLSANLGVINLLPIPAMDGGRALFILIEIVRGKPMDREKEGLVHTIGMVCLMILMVFLLFNDVRKLF